MKKINGCYYIVENEEELDRLGIGLNNFVYPQYYYIERDADYDFCTPTYYKKLEKDAIIKVIQTNIEYYKKLLKMLDK